MYLPCLAERSCTYMCHHVGLYPDESGAYLQGSPRVCGQLNWLHLYSSSFLQGRICISPHSLICISLKDTSVFLHTGWFVFLASAVMVTSLQRLGFLFPTGNKGSKTSALSPSLSLLFVITILMTAGICPCLHHDLKNFSSLPTYRSLPLSSSWSPLH